MKKLIQSVETGQVHDDCSRCTPDVGPVNLTGSSGLTAAVKHERFVMDSSESRYP
jgi:hypothetical protein